MARTADEIVQQYLADQEERRRLDQEPTRPATPEEIKKAAVYLNEHLQNMDVEEVERAAERYREDENVAEAILELMDALEREKAHRMTVEGMNRAMRDDLSEQYRKKQS